MFNQRNINAADLAPSLVPPALHHLQKKKTFPLTPAVQNSVELSCHIMSSHESKAHACLDLQGSPVLIPSPAIKDLYVVHSDLKSEY